MRKNIIYVVIALMMSMVGCEFENVDYQVISPEIFLKNENDARALVTACYTDIKQGGDYGFWCNSGNSFSLVTEMTTDIMQCNWGDGGIWSNLSELKYTPTNGGMAISMYGYYRNISKYTLDIDRIQKLDMGNTDIKDQYIAEVKALRGWLSYLLYVHYGTFPVASIELLTNPLEEVLLPREEPEVLKSMIETDLKDAVSVLPEGYDNSENGRITKGAARMILMKFYMATSKWKEAETVGREIMGMDYALMANYEDIFKLENAYNKECIYSIPCSSNQPNYWLNWTLPYNYVTENPNISKWSGFRSRWEFFDTFDREDKRLKLLVSEYLGADGVVYNRENPGGAGEIGLGPIPVKYGEDPSDAGFTSSNPIVVFRYADAKLLLAEAINRQVGPTQEAIDLVNEIRLRAGVKPFTLSDVPSQEKFNEVILAERGRELFSEGHRREDLIRHGKFIEYAKKRPNALADDYKVLFPIPQNYINEGQGVVIQNPGY